MLAGYTANGDKPYCDGQPHTATDRAWLTLYVPDGADPATCTTTGLATLARRRGRLAAFGKRPLRSSREPSRERACW